MATETGLSEGMSTTSQEMNDHLLQGKGRPLCQERVKMTSCGIGGSQGPHLIEMKETSGYLFWGMTGSLGCHLQDMKGKGDHHFLVTRETDGLLFHMMTEVGGILFQETRETKGLLLCGMNMTGDLCVGMSASQDLHFQGMRETEETSLSLGMNEKGHHFPAMTWKGAPLSLGLNEMEDHQFQGMRGTTDLSSQRMTLRGKPHLKTGDLKMIGTVGHHLQEMNLSYEMKERGEHHFWEGKGKEGHRFPLKKGIADHHSHATSEVFHFHHLQGMQGTDGCQEKERKEIYVIGPGRIVQLADPCHLRDLAAEEGRC